jgi:REP element-mobilizing transposase RayT
VAPGAHASNSAMKFNPEIHHRRSIRLQTYDYTQAGAYFVTLCSQNRECLFGQIENGETRLSAAGSMIESVWNEIPENYPGIDIAEFVVMPNHIHGIIVIVGATPCGCPPHGCPETGHAQERQGHAREQQGQARGPAPTETRLSLPDVVHRFKTMTTKRYADGVKQCGWPPFPGRLWQRNYWEHVIRNESDLARIREYIQNNPTQWALDRLNPQHRDDGLGEVVAGT